MYCAYICHVDARTGRLLSSSIIYYLIFLRQDLPLIHNLIWLTGQCVWRTLLFLPLNAGLFPLRTRSGFCVNTEKSKSGHQYCKASILINQAIFIIPTVSCPNDNHFVFVITFTKITLCLTSIEVTLFLNIFIMF